MAVAYCLGLHETILDTEFIEDKKMTSDSFKMEN